MRAFEGLEYVPSQQRNPMVPVWMDAALRTAVEIPWRRRYGVMSELLYDLRHPNGAFLKEEPRPLIERDPLRFWKGWPSCSAWPGPPPSGSGWRARSLRGRRRMWPGVETARWLGRKRSFRVKPPL